MPLYKSKYKERPVDSIDVSDDSKILSAKIDGAHTLFVFPKTDHKIRAISYRQTKREQGVIEHTHKVPGLEGTERTPKDLRDTVIRGELYAMKGGKATPSEILAGMLNANVWKSREKQTLFGKLKAAIFDVIKYKGKNYEKAPYSDKLKILKEIAEKYPKTFHLPPMAVTSKEKDKLIDKIKSGRLPETEEGVVEWDLHAGTPPIKSKLNKEFDVFIRGFEKGKGKYETAVGAVTYSHSPHGEIVGNVGSGLNDKQRKDMATHPKNYLGLVAKIKSSRKMKSGALYQPSFAGFHLDKNEQSQLDKVEE